MSDFSDMEDDIGQPMPRSTDHAKKHAREQHNALERRRRDNIKDMYQHLREVVPEANTERASRAVILKKTMESIQKGQAENAKLTRECAQLDLKNAQLKEEIEKLRAKKRAKANTQ